MRTVTSPAWRMRSRPSLSKTSPGPRHEVRWVTPDRISQVVQLSCDRMSAGIRVDRCYLTNKSQPGQMRKDGTAQVQTEPDEDAPQRLPMVSDRER